MDLIETVKKKSEATSILKFDTFVKEAILFYLVTRRAPDKEARA